MKIVRAPLRVSLFGGGTDYPHYYEEHGSTIVSFAIDRHIYVTWNDRPTGGCRVSYSQVEELEKLADAEHTLVRAVAEQYPPRGRRAGIPEPCTLTITSDIPKGTGLGSSSALAVALCNLVDATFYEDMHLAHVAYVLERGVSPNVGCQDHLPAAFGGFNVYHIGQGRDAALVEYRGSQELTTWKRLHAAMSLRVEALPAHCRAIIDRFGLLLYTGESRDSGPQMRRWRGDRNLPAIHQLADRMAGCVDHWSPQSLAEALDETWQAKRKVGGVSNPAFDEQYQTALGAGAWGGKLCGAGGGGCWFFLVPREKRQAVIDALGMAEIPFQVSEKGVQKWTL
jgi:D-glycero-alpha-D-manno-heptose-7-phosphate kinase